MEDYDETLYNLSEFDNLKLSVKNINCFAVAIEKICNKLSVEIFKTNTEFKNFLYSELERLEFTLCVSEDMFDNVESNYETVLYFLSLHTGLFVHFPKNNAK
jgi:DUF4097 and DUF4098 domain-containing protein YvlB